MSMTVATDRSLIDEAVARLRHHAAVLRSTDRADVAVQIDDVADDVGAEYAAGQVEQWQLEAFAAVMGVTRVADV